MRNLLELLEVPLLVLLYAVSCAIGLVVFWSTIGGCLYLLDTIMQICD